MARPKRRKKKSKFQNVSPQPQPSASRDSKLELFQLARKKVESHVQKALAEDRSPMTLVRMGLEAVRTCEGVMDDLHRDFQPELACREGCDMCCYPPVSATVPEVANIVAYLLTQVSEEEFLRLEGRVNEVAEEIKYLSGPERSACNIACPYLKGGRCSVYPVRPLACRGFNSNDRSVCEEVFSNPQDPPMVPAFVPLIVTAQGMKEGLFHGLQADGLPNPMLDLVKGSKKLLESFDESLEDWLQGRDVFADCQPF